MKNKFFKSYDNFKKVSENVMSLSNSSEIQNFNESDKNLEDIKENDEEVKSSFDVEECESCQDKIGLGEDSEKKVELPSDTVMPVIGHIMIATELEVSKDETLPISEPINTNSFNPSQDINILETPSNNIPKLFSIVKIMTQNGEKIGMCYTDDVDEYGTPLHNNIDFSSCCELIKTCCLEHGIEEFKNDIDKIVGAIPSFMIPKINKNITSYRPN